MRARRASAGSSDGSCGTSSPGRHARGSRRAASASGAARARSTLASRRSWTAAPPPPGRSAAAPRAAAPGLASGLTRRKLEIDWSDRSPCAVRATCVVTGRRAECQITAARGSSRVMSERGSTYALIRDAARASPDTHEPRPSLAVASDVDEHVARHSSRDSRNAAVCSRIDVRRRSRSRGLPSVARSRRVTSGTSRGAERLTVSAVGDVAVAIGDVAEWRLARQSVVAARCSIDTDRRRRREPRSAAARDASAASRRERCSSIAATIRRCSFSGGSGIGTWPRRRDLRTAGVARARLSG